jgi:hypothetical protein
MTRLYSNNFSTTLNGAITDVATSMTLTSVTGFPAVGSGDTAQVTITDGTNTEVVTATAIAGSVITITRAQEGTSGTAFADADTVEIRVTALSHTDVLSADLTPSIAGPLDVSGDYVGFGGSSTSTAYCLTHTANVPKLVGAANYYWGFSGSKLYAQAGTTFNSITFANDSTRLAIKTNNSERLSVNDSGTQFGATGARITHTIDDDTMATASATTLATSESIKAYADSVGSGAPEGTAVLSTGEVGGTKYLREDGDGTCSWQTVSGGGDVVDDTTPQLGGELDANSNAIDISSSYISFGGSSSSTLYSLSHSANVPKLQGGASVYWGFSGTTGLYCQAGTSFNSITFKNDSTRFVLKTNNSERLSVNDSGTQFGASGARITTVLDEDTMSSDSATALATQQSIKAYVDASGGGGGVAIGKIIAMNYIMG